MEKRFEGLEQLRHGDIARALDRLCLPKDRLRFAIADLALRFLGPTYLEHAGYPELASDLRAASEVVDEHAATTAERALAAAADAVGTAPWHHGLRSARAAIEHLEDDIFLANAIFMAIGRIQALAGHAEMHRTLEMWVTHLRSPST